jgi:hypothetical protein
MKSFFLTFLLFFILLSCSNNNDISDNLNNNAKVLRVGMDCCNTYLVKFFDSYSNIPQNTAQNTFYAINLPEEYKIENLEIRINYRLPNENEILNCTSEDIAYPQIYIENVE